VPHGDPNPVAPLRVRDETCEIPNVPGLADDHDHLISWFVVTREVR
jgi:hypothetical protein